jgi:quercetin dioxygenase-like cupin family protein
MTKGIRRVTTGHDQNGRAIVKADEFLPFEKRLLHNWLGVDIWATVGVPVSNDDKEVTPIQSGPKGQRTVIRTSYVLPGGFGKMHRTETLDYAILVEGEAEMELDGGETVKLKAGDIVIQRGTNHAWFNRSDKPCRFVFVLFDAKPVHVGDKILRDYLDELPAGMQVMLSKPIAEEK